jgi:hypothetical protein
MESPSGLLPDDSADQFAWQVDSRGLRVAAYQVATRSSSACLQVPAPSLIGPSCVCEILLHRFSDSDIDTRIDGTST